MPQPFPFRKQRRRSVMVSVGGMTKLVPYDLAEAPLPPPAAAV
jgi:hypothetical protein